MRRLIQTEKAKWKRVKRSNAMLSALLVDEAIPTLSLELQN